ncbi:rhomboid family intramembrane serine protease [Ohtaekwangia koreensis]|uniref:Membrane associated serine protease, rhomboid family n=1 Tax=Ohtaekwangia koreensis TaxID=688867 RepID=A0A1T5IN41_9BACT|nr:rhomboid family intramembrane serine protease [Ohtaekwangia koreensis]SKC40383.1 Membrane associated serine protease, rhomboid family [Ohtaekwangia koreensis]
MFDEFKNAFNRYNNAHVQLIIINVVVFLALGILYVVAKISQTQPIFQIVYDQFTLPSVLSEFVTKPWTLITYAFAHHFSYEFNEVGISHIFFNLLVFYWFAKLFVEYLGSDKLIAVYILGGLSGGALYLLLYNTVPFFIQQPSLLVGSSAAVYAVVTAAATLLPEYTFFLLFIGPIRIKYIAAFYIAISFLLSVGSNAGGNIAHLGGALIGFIYIKQLQAGSNWGGWITATLDWIKGLFKPRLKVKVSYRNEDTSSFKNAKPKGSSISQAEIDAILDKISDGGYESLTKEEKDKLFNASKKQ